MEKYRVRITSFAEGDIVDIFNYISINDSIESAEYVLGELEKLILALDEHPERGHYPPELIEHGIKTYREVFFKPYRIIYEVTKREVVIHLCVDGRRDMQTLLTRRVIR